MICNNYILQYATIVTKLNNIDTSKSYCVFMCQHSKIQYEIV